MNKKTINQYISLNDKSDGQIVELDIYGEIADNKWWDEDVTAKCIKDALSKYDKAKTLEIHACSYGGSTAAGNAIIAIINAFKKKTKCFVESYIEGMCASMTSGIVMVADKIYMCDNALLLIHKPLGRFEGNADDLQKGIDLLNKTEDCLIKNYMKHWNKSEEELRDALAVETVYTCEEALEVGLCDEIIEGFEMVASAKGLQIGNGVFSDKVADLIKEKYPNAKLDKKEEKDLNYDEKLKDYGIDEETFNAFNLESETVLNVAKAVKVAEKETETPVVAEQFVDKATVCDALGCEDITAEELINYAKVGVNPPQIDNTATEKAKAYDEIVDKAREDALKNAMRAEGDLYDEARTKKMLNALDYSEIVAQNDAWCKKAEKELNAGERVSYVASNYVRESRPVNTNDYIIG